MASVHSPTPADASSPSSPRAVLALALDGTGWHPGSWRRPESGAESVFTGRYWQELARAADRAGVDVLTLEDAFGPQAASPRPDAPVAGVDRLRGRLDAALLAAWLATRTERIGLVPTVTTTHTEPFHTSKNIATLDHVSLGRAGWRVQISGRPAEAAHTGRREVADPLADPASLTALFAEAGEAVQVVRALWDSWEDDAEIREEATGRFIDRDKLHYIDFVGQSFSVKGPSITPRPPQGQPVVHVLAHQELGYELAAREADVLWVTPHTTEQATSILAQVRDAERRVGRAGSPLVVLADVEVLLADTHPAALARREELDSWAGGAVRSDALQFTGTPAELAGLLTQWHGLGYDGFRLRPAEHAHDVAAITRDLVPLLRAAGVLAETPPDGTQRERLGLPVATNRYAAAS